jgi:hypothetical protein
MENSARMGYAGSRTWAWHARESLALGFEALGQLLEALVELDLGLAGRKELAVLDRGPSSLRQAPST